MFFCLSFQFYIFLSPNKLKKIFIKKINILNKINKYIKKILMLNLLTINKINIITKKITKNW